MNDNAYERQTSLPNNFSKNILDAKEARKAVMMFKDEYTLDFLNVEEIGERDFEDIDEPVVEQQVIQNIKKFIITFGHDFAFIGNQYHEVYGVEHLRHRSFDNFIVNLLGVIAAYCCFPKKPCINVTRTIDTQLALF